MDVGEKVFKAIEKIGGRFMSEVKVKGEQYSEGSGRWFEVARSRALEKTCQALREKEKAKPPTGDPFKDPNRKTSLSPTNSGSDRKMSLSPTNAGSASPPKKRSAASEADDSGSEEEAEGTGFAARLEKAATDKTEGRGEEKGGNGAGAEVADNKPGAEEVAAAAAATWKSPIAKLKELPADDMVEKLVKFKNVHGHCGVPPGWPGDVVLANWCTIQRQSRKEIRFGYREATDSEAALEKRLDDVSFVWDYAEWHWQGRCEQLKAFKSLEGGSGNGGNNKNDEGAACEPQTIVDWLQDQRSQLRTGTAEMSAERAEKLQKLGVAL